MSEGSPKVVVRIPAPLLAECELTIARRNLFTLAEPWDFSKFVRAALQEKIAKMDRSRCRIKRAVKVSEKPEFPDKSLDEEGTED